MGGEPGRRPKEVFGGGGWDEQKAKNMRRGVLGEKREGTRRLEVWAGDRGMQVIFRGRGRKKVLERVEF